MIIIVIECNLVLNFLLKVTATFTAEGQCYMIENKNNSANKYVKIYFSIILESYTVNIK